MVQQTGWARKEWVRESALQTTTAAELSLRLKDEIKRRGGSSLVVFDLDSTLYEVAPRTHAIIQEALEHSPHTKWPEPVRAALSRVEISQIGYSLRDTFQTLGLSLSEKEIEAACVELKTFWWNRFFTNGYLKHDKTYPGAVEFVQSVKEAGAEVLYLTGREHAKMWDGTVENLKRDGLWWGDQTELLLRPDGMDADLLHKIEAVRKLKARTSHLLASFENEPVNLASLHSEVPEALHVFLDTVCSDSLAEVRPGILRLTGYL